MKKFRNLIVSGVLVLALGAGGFLFMGFNADSNTSLGLPPAGMLYNESDIYLGNNTADTSAWYPAWGYLYCSTGFKVCKVHRNTVTGVDSTGVQVYMDVSMNPTVSTSIALVESCYAAAAAITDTTYKIKNWTITNAWYKIRFRYVADNGSATSTDSALIIDRRTILSRP